MKGINGLFLLERSKMNRIDQLFEQAKKDKRTVFVPFLTAGDPDINATMKIAGDIHRTTKELGVPTVLELGFPYSDPMADGPTIQSAYNRALDGGITVQAIFDGVREFRKTSDLPLVGMVSYAIVYRKDPTDFLRSAKEAGFDGVIIPDLPVEESESARAWGEKNEFKLIQLVAPTTRPDRLPKIAAASTGFIYYISVAGITGERRALPPDLIERVKAIREHARVPICIGFGVSGPDQVKQLSEWADGVIVGSALVRRVAELSSISDTTSITDFVRHLLEPLAR
jgi:tryptophan synthase alpha chain